MAKDIPSALQTHLDGSETSLATCWEVTRRDGAVLRLTDHDVDLLVEGDVYVAAVGFQRTAIGTRGDGQVDQVDVTGIFDSSSITEEDLLAGRYNFAGIR